MPPNAIVITFNIAEDCRFGLLDRFKNAAFNQFRLKARKEAFCHRIVITIPLCRHRLPEAVNIQQSPIFDRCALAAAISVNNRPAFYQTPTPSTVKGIDHELRRHPFRNLPADNPSGELVLKSCQIAELSASERQIRNIADDHLSRAGRRGRQIAQQIR